MTDKTTQPIPEWFEKWITEQFGNDAGVVPGKGNLWVGWTKGTRAAYRLLCSEPLCRWVSVEEALPEYTEYRMMWNDETNQREPYGEPAFQTVLAYNEELGIFKAEYAKHGHWSEVSSISTKGSVKPTHWMPLPKPPIPSSDSQKSPIKTSNMSDQNQNLRAATLGEMRVRANFNVSASDVVAQIKQKSAELIDLCETLKAKDGRLASLAQTSYEEAAMWAVKAATA